MASFTQFLHLTHLAQARQRVKIAVSAGLFAAFWLAWPWLIVAWGIPYRALALSYLILAGLFWGLKGGVGAALAHLAALPLLLHLVGSDYIGGILTPIVTVTITALVGRLTDSRLALESEAAQRRQAHQQLQAYQVDLEQIVVQRTDNLAEANRRLQEEIGERKRAEAALRQSEEQYRHLVEDINDVIYSLDKNGVLTYLSPAVEAHSGYTPAELIGRVFSDFIYEDDRAKILEEFEAVLAGRLQPSEYRIVSKSGDLRWIRSSSRAIYQDGKSIGLRGSYIDITEKRQLEGQLRQTQKMEAIGTLAGGIAHEFNNTLAAILGFTQLATYDIAPATSTYQHLQAVLSAGNRAKELIQQILTFSHQISPERQAVDLALLVQENLSLIRALLPTTIAIESHIAPDAGTVLADPTQLHQIVMNLCANADHAMRQTGSLLEIEVARVEMDADVVASEGLHQPGSYVRLTIRDTGCGMSPEVVARIFEPFFTTKGIGEGTGMGLSIVHGIVASYGGSMMVQSRPGEGSEFAIYLPRIETPAVVETPTVTDPLSQGHGCILYVDDEALLVRLGREMLESLGYEVYATSSSVDALETFGAKPQRFDLVITDQTMPTLTGEELARELRHIRSDIPIILCTGFSHVIDAEKAKSVGIDEFCMKPLDMGELGRTIERVLGRQGDVGCKVAPFDL